MHRILVAAVVLGGLSCFATTADAANYGYGRGHVQARGGYGYGHGHGYRYATGYSLPRYGANYYAYPPPCAYPAYGAYRYPPPVHRGYYNYGPRGVYIQGRNYSLHYGF